MATHLVGSTAPLYANLADWATARAGTFDATEIAQLQNEVHTSTGCVLETWASSTVHVIIEGVSAQDGDFSTGARYSFNSGSVVQSKLQTNDLTIRNLTAYTAGGGFARFLYLEFLSQTTGVVSLENCLFRDFSGYGAGVIASEVTYTTGQTVINVDNCVFSDCSGGQHGALGFGYSAGPVIGIDLTMRGCTFDNSRISIWTDNSGANVVDVTAIGCLFNASGGFDDIDWTGTDGTLTSTSTSNITADSSATHNANWGTVTNLSASATFNDTGTPNANGVWWTDAANDDYSLQDDAYNIALGHVTSGTMPSTDVAGTTRDANPDAGAFEVAAGVGVTVTPGAASLTLTAQTPTVTNPVTVTPGVASLTTTAQTPTVSNPVTVTPGIASLTATAQTPTTVANATQTPGVATLTLTAQTPTVSNPVTVTPGVASLTATAQTPTTVANATQIPATASLTLTAQTPTVTNPVTVTPGVASLIVTPQTPTVISGTKTALTSFASGYAVGRQHVHFDVRSSTPTSGAVYEGIGEFRVVRGGSVIKRVSNVHEFAWLGEDGDEVHARFTDRTGDKGSWSSYTFSVTGTYAVEYYVNGSTGNDTTGDGSSGNPWATIGKGVTEIRAHGSMTTGAVGALHIAENQTYDMAGAAVHSAENTTERRIDFLRWGTASSAPSITNCGGFICGTKGSFLVDGFTISGTSNTFDLGRGGGTVGDRRAYNVIVRSCEIIAADRGLTWDDAVPTSADRDVCSFVFLEDVQFTETTNFPMYGYAFPQHWAFVRTTILDFTGGGSSPFRGGRFARSYFEQFDITPTVASLVNSIRWIFGNGSGESAMHSCSWHGCRFEPRDYAQFWFESDGASAIYATDLTFADCHWDAQEVRSVECRVDSATSGAFQRVVFRNCNLVAGFSPLTNASLSGFYDDILFVQCAGVGRYDNQPLVNTGSDAGAIADGAFTFYGCVSYFPGASSFNLISTTSAAKVGAVEYCHVGTSGASGTIGIINGSTPSGTNTGTASTTFNWTNNGSTFGAFDPALTSVSSGDTELAGAGWPHSYSIDANGFLRDVSTPDAGPYEYGATATPNDPTLTSVTVTPGTATLTLTAQAPTQVGNATQTPGIATLTLTAQTPTVTVGANTTVTPGIATLTVTAQTPTLTTTANVTVTPGVASLTMSAQTPTLTATDHITLTPGVVALTISPHTPVVSSGVTLLVPGVGRLRAWPYRARIVTTTSPRRERVRVTLRTPGRSTALEPKSGQGWYQWMRRPFGRS